jgi:hypothetical protein
MSSATEHCVAVAVCSCSCFLSAVGLVRGVEQLQVPVVWLARGLGLAVLD